MTKSAKKKLAPKKVPAKKLAAKTPAKIAAKVPAGPVTTIPAKNALVKTDDEKRLARNQSLRAWRALNRAKVAAYMAAWRKARKEPMNGRDESPVKAAPKSKLVIVKKMVAKRARRATTA